MHSNDLEACWMKFCCFWFHSDVKFLTRSLYSGERQWLTWASCYFLFLFSENYLSTIFYSDIIETVIYSAYMSSLKTSKEGNLPPWLLKKSETAHEQYFAAFSVNFHDIIIPTIATLWFISMIYCISPSLHCFQTGRCKFNLKCWLMLSFSHSSQNK